MLTDEGCLLERECQTIQLCFNDIKEKLHKDMMVDIDIRPVGGHNFNRKVERKIYQIKESLKKLYQIKNYLFCNRIQ